LNNDTTINQRTIPILESAIKQNDSIAIATSKIVMMDNPNILWYGGGDIDWKNGSAKIQGYLGDSNTEIANLSRIVSFASGCAMLIKRSILEKFKGFDERFFMYVEDLEFCIRIIKKNYKIIYVPDSVVYHKCQGSQRKSQKFYRLDDPKNPNLPFLLYNLNKNRIITIFQHASLRQKIHFLSYYPLTIIFKCFKYLSYKRVDSVIAIFNSTYDALKSFRKPLITLSKR
jgi:GT2 family glycosyltransferase